MSKIGFEVGGKERLFCARFVNNIEQRAETRDKRQETLRIRLCARVSRDTFKGRSSESTTPLTKFMYLEEV
jgi:hypothetical protein